ncbi:MAG: DNA repair protein RadC [Planctomycetes bacterium]|nr:DNA repair protein RadC [Planctomycetota bacterium]
MTLALAAALAERPDATRRFLRAAVTLDEPSVSGLVDAGIPHWDASDLMRRLEAAGEMRASRWSDHARASYASLVADTDTVAEAPTVASTLLDQLSPGDRPREKALRSGIESLADAELVALLLRTGPSDEGVLAFAARLLRDHDGLVGLSRRAVEDLVAARGLGPAKAAELAAAFEIARRLSLADLGARPVLKTPEAVAELLAPLAASLPHEELWCLPLDPQSRLIGRPRVISRGDVDGTDAGPRAFFRIALAAGATSCIAVHNHPGGDPTPSAADRSATIRLVAGGRAIDLPLVDHVVMGTAGRFTSLRRAAPECFRAV